MQTQPKLVAIDLDKTLAVYDHGDLDKYGIDHIGAPIAEMVQRVKDEMRKGTKFMIFTARVNPATDSYEDQMNATLAIPIILAWCKKNLGVEIPIIHRKLQSITEFWDDRAVAVVPNTGVFVTDLMDALAK